MLGKSSIHPRQHEISCRPKGRRCWVVSVVFHHRTAASSSKMTSPNKTPAPQQQQGSNETSTTASHAEDPSTPHPEEGPPAGLQAVSGQPATSTFPDHYQARLAAAQWSKPSYRYAGHPSSMHAFSPPRMTKVRVGWVPSLGNSQ